MIESRVTDIVFRRFAQTVTSYDVSGNESEMLVIIDRNIERYNAQGSLIVDVDMMTALSESNVTRGYYISSGSLWWQVRDRISDDGHVAEWELKRTVVNLENTLDATLDISL
jgi:hypothetical protein